MQTSLGIEAHDWMMGMLSAILWREYMCEQNKGYVKHGVRLTVLRLVLLSG